MRLEAMEKYNLTCELWEYYLPEAGNIGDGKVKFYFLRTNLKINMGQDALTPRQNVYCEAPVRQGAQIRAVKDSHGNELLKDGIWNITGIQPNINTLGHTEGYHMTAALAYYGDFDYEFQEDVPPGGSL